MQEQLRDVQHIFATCNAFAAVKGDGSVITWGNAKTGGDSTLVQEQLKEDEHVFLSGSFPSGRNSNSVQELNQGERLSKQRRLS